MFLHYVVRHILYLTDLSAAASLAYQHAQMLAQRWHARVHILYWADRVGYTWTAPQSILSTTPARAAGIPMHSTGEPADAGLRPWLKQVTARDAVEVATEGNPVDLLVLGIQSQRAAERLVPDSLAEVLLEDWKTPVWVAGPHCLAPEPASAIEIPGRCHVRPPRRVLVPTLLQPEGTALPLALQWVRENRGDLTLLHVLPSPQTGALESAARELARLAPPNASKLRVRSAASAAQGILEESAEFDLVVMAAPNVTAWTLAGDGTVGTVVGQLPCPALIVPGTWQPRTAQKTPAREERRA